MGEIDDGAEEADEDGGVVEFEGDDDELLEGGEEGNAASARNDGVPVRVHDRRQGIEAEDDVGVEEEAGMAEGRERPS